MPSLERLEVRYCLTSVILISMTRIGSPSTIMASFPYPSIAPAYLLRGAKDNCENAREFSRDEAKVVIESRR